MRVYAENVVITVQDYNNTHTVKVMIVYHRCASSAFWCTVSL